MKCPIFFYTVSQRASFVWRLMTVIGFLFVAAIRAEAPGEITRTKKKRLRSVQYRAGSGGWTLRLIIRGSGRARSGAIRSATKPMDEQSSSSMGTTLPTMHQGDASSLPGQFGKQLDC